MSNTNAFKTSWDSLYINLIRVYNILNNNNKPNKGTTLKPEQTQITNDTTTSEQSVNMKDQFAQANGFLSNQIFNPSDMSVENVKHLMDVLFNKNTGTVYLEKAKMTKAFKAKTYKEDGISRKDAKKELKRFRLMYTNLKALYKELLANAKAAAKAARGDISGEAFEAKKAKAAARIHKAFDAYKRLTGDTYMDIVDQPEATSLHTEDIGA